MVKHIDDIIDRIDWCLAKRVLGGRSLDGIQTHPNSRYAVLAQCKNEIIKLRRIVAEMDKLLTDKESP